MNYFPFHIGDYASHTSHLDPMEDLTYRRLIDIYYMREGPLPTDVQATAKLVRMKVMIDVVKTVLNEFFERTEAGWVHLRCEKELEHMRDKRAKAQASAAISVSKRIANANKKLSERSADAQKISTDAELPTPTPTPIPRKNTKNTSAIAPPDGVCESVWRDFVQHRKNKKAQLTQTAMEGIQSEANKAGWTLEAAFRECCTRGWTGFKAEWVQKKSSNGHQPAVSFKQQDAQIERDRWEEMTGRTHPDNLPKQASNVIEIQSKLLEITR